MKPGCIPKYLSSSAVENNSKLRKGDGYEWQIWGCTKRYCEHVVKVKLFLYVLESIKYTLIQVLGDTV